MSEERNIYCVFHLLRALLCRVILSQQRVGQWWRKARRYYKEAGKQRAMRVDFISQGGTSILRLELCNLDIEWFVIFQIQLRDVFQKLRLKMKDT